jgi:ATP-binding cassette subfamily F protein 3
MVISVDITEKSFGDKSLYHDLQFEVQEGEKVGLIGRNGTGKSTLLNMITGGDKDFQGDITVKRHAIMVFSRQEHHGLGDTEVLDYIQGDLPEFAKLHHTISTYPESMGSDERKLQAYSDALERFSQLGYFQVEDELQQACEAYQLDPAILERPLASLSGGQARLVELMKVQRARGDVALIDEPTNHMDYIAKQTFIKWLQAASEAVLVITHDRDVLQTVDRIVEVRDGQAYTFKGNYEHYLRTNKHAITAQVNEYDLTQRRIKNLGEDIIRFRRMKERARDPGTIKRFKSQEIKAETELAKLQQTVQPSFWIDRESAADLTPKLTAAYGKYKAKNIKLDTHSLDSESSRLLVDVTKLSLGYNDKPLFEDLSFQLHEGERLRLHGRNGAGKTTLMDAIMTQAQTNAASSTRISGRIAVEHDLPIGRYEQEIDERFLQMPLGQAIEKSLDERGEPVSEQKVRQLLGEYLFEPVGDYNTPISQLSGGQKARFQLIRMLLGKPLLLILDEPTNHLDLPSIEELEDALARYKGAVIFISHDSYFANKIGGSTIQIGNAKN